MKRALFAVVALSLFAVGCWNRNGDDEVVASVYDHKLMKGDLVGLVAEGVGGDDSVAIVDNYIDQWVRQAVMLAKAEKNVHDDFGRQLDEYRNSLLIYAYEQQIVNQMLDTNVGDEAIEEYYNAHQADFQLKSSIVKAVYVVSPRKAAANQRLEKMVKKSGFGEGDVVELEEFASRNGLRGYYDVTAWMPFYTLQQAVPITTFNEDLFLKRNHAIVLQDDSLSYFVNIMDYKVSDEVAPIELQRDNIRAIIINRRKVDLLSKMQTDLVQKAEKTGAIKRPRRK